MGQGNLAKVTWSARLLEMVSIRSSAGRRDRICSLTNGWLKPVWLIFYLFWMLLLVNGGHGREKKSFSLFALQWCFIPPSSLTFNVHNCPHVWFPAVLVPAVPW